MNFKQVLKTIALILPVAFFAIGFPQSANAITAQLTKAPNVPEALNRSRATNVVINLEAKEYVGDLAEGKKYHFWSFGG
ncbi:MAG TPA: nitrite reductase, copper-containing, partial [Nitrospinaceae bacterium]|nr:nitrite reductase, copper-containing [Nitrospinaceae bacterium]